jgi:hypothetical protein
MAPSGYWQRRNARAVELGYRNYYDYRAHDNGRLPPDAPRLSGDELTRSRGHASGADLVKLLRAKRVEMIGVVATVDSRGRPTIAALAMLNDGRTREFELNEKAILKVRATLDEGDPEAVLLVGSPSIVRTLIGRKRRDWRFKLKA